MWANGVTCWNEAVLEAPPFTTLHKHIPCSSKMIRSRDTGEEDLNQGTFVAPVKSLVNFSVDAVAPSSAVMPNYEVAKEKATRTNSRTMG
jgi:hypothetical protein